MARSEAKSLFFQGFKNRRVSKSGAPGWVGVRIPCPPLDVNSFPTIACVIRPKRGQIGHG